MRRPLSFEFITTSALANFLIDLPEFLTCSNASIGTNEGRIEKSSENCVDSSDGKLTKGEFLGLVCFTALSTVAFDRLSFSSFAFV